MVSRESDRVIDSEDDQVRNVTIVTVVPLHVRSYVSSWEIHRSGSTASRVSCALDTRLLCDVCRYYGTKNDI
eukprot:3148665-Rhodomonas_salina.1